VLRVAYFLEVLVAFITLAGAAFLAAGFLAAAFFAAFFTAGFLGGNFLGGRLLGGNLLHGFLGCRLLGNLLYGGFLGGLLGGRFLCSGFLGSGHSSSQLLISWQWLPSKSVQERFNQQVAVGSVPKIVHLTVRAQIRKPPQNMQRNRDSDLAYRVCLFTVLDIRLDEFCCCHNAHSP
jgi:hypothetical protein